MRISYIKKLVNTAYKLNLENNIIGAFALYWIAYEGLWARGLVKALWLRGCKVKDAEQFIEMYHHNDPITFAGKITGTYIETKSFYKLIYNNYQMRSRFFHRGIQYTKSMKLMNQAFEQLFKNPEILFYGMMVEVEYRDGRIVHLPIGNPLIQIKKQKLKDRPPAVKAKGIVDVEDLIESPKLKPVITEIEIAEAITGHLENNKRYIKMKSNQNKLVTVITKKNRTQKRL